MMRSSTDHDHFLKVGTDRSGKSGHGLIGSAAIPQHGLDDHRIADGESQLIQTHGLRLLASGIGEDGTGGEFTQMTAERY